MFWNFPVSLPNPVHEFNFHYKDQLINVVYTESITEYMNTQ